MKKTEIGFDKFEEDFTAIPGTQFIEKADQKPKTCLNCGTQITKEYCEDYPKTCEHWTPQKPKTNFDRIKAMTVEELADFIGESMDHIEPCDACQAYKVCSATHDFDCKKSWEIWLNQEVDHE